MEATPRFPESNLSKKYRAKSDRATSLWTMAAGTDLEFSTPAPLFQPDIDEEISLSQKRRSNESENSNDEDCTILGISQPNTLDNEKSQINTTPSRKKDGNGEKDEDRGFKIAALALKKVSGSQKKKILAEQEEELNQMLDEQEKLRDSEKQGEKEEEEDDDTDLLRPLLSPPPRPRPRPVRALSEGNLEDGVTSFPLSPSSVHSAPPLDSSTSPMNKRKRDCLEEINRIEQEYQRICAEKKEDLEKDIQDLERNFYQDIGILAMEKDTAISELKAKYNLEETLILPGTPRQGSLRIERRSIESPRTRFLSPSQSPNQRTSPSQPSQRAENLTQDLFSQSIFSRTSRPIPQNRGGVMVSPGTHINSFAFREQEKENRRNDEDSQVLSPPNFKKFRVKELKEICKDYDVGIGRKNVMVDNLIEAWSGLEMSQQEEIRERCGCGNSGVDEKEKKVAQCIKNNRQLYKAVLIFKSIEIDEVQKKLKEGGVKVGKAWLRDYLNIQGSQVFFIFSFSLTLFCRS